MTTAPTMKRLSIPPYHKGYFTVRNIEYPHRDGNKWVQTALSFGSKSAISVTKSPRRSFYAALFSTYNPDQETHAVIACDDGSEKRLRRIFIKATFPFLSLNSQAAYKSIHVTCGFAPNLVRRVLQIRIGATNDTHDTCQVLPVADTELYTDFGAVDAKITQLEATDGALDIEMFSVLDRSLHRLRNHIHIQSFRNALARLHCTFTVNHRLAHDTMGEWTDEEKINGSQESIDTLNARLQKITYPLGVGRHGYCPSFKHLDVPSVEVELQAMIEKLQTLNVQPFLNSGTLLGYFRDGGPIPHDDDFDLGILVPGDTEDEALRNWRAFGDAVRYEFPTINKGNLLALTLTNDVQVDLFAAWINDEKVHIHPYCWAAVNKDVLLPLKPLEIRDSAFPIPADPDALLQVNYGPSWRVPDPFWTWDYRQTRKNFKGVSKKLKADYVR